MEKVRAKMRFIPRRLSPLGVILILLGGCLMAFPLYGAISTRAAVNQLNKQWEAVRTELPDTEAGMEPEAAAAPQEQASAAANTSTAAANTAAAALTPVMNTPPPIGRITIAKIDLSAPIVEGVDTSAIRYAVGHLGGSAKLGGTGNSVLAGHRSYTFGEFFNRLDEVAVGDMVRVETSSRDVTYKVTGTKVVEPADLSVLDDTSPQSTLTIITCTPKHSSEYRLIVTAEKTAEQPVHRN